MSPDKLITGRWHDRAGHSPTTLTQQYGTPSGWYRRSLYVADQKDGALEQRELFQYIRAAAIFRRGTRITSLTVDPAWTVMCNLPHKDWILLLVSVKDTKQWLQRAYDAGALAWWVCEPGPLFKYEPIKHPDPQEETAFPLNERGAGQYNRQALKEEIANGTASVIELAKKYGISRTMVYQIKSAMRAGRTRINRKPRDNELRPEQIEPIIRDIQSGMYGKDAIAERNGVTKYHVTGVINRYNLKGLLPRGYANKKLKEELANKKAP